MQKKELRKKYKALRSELDVETRVTLSNQILDRLRSNFDLTGKKVSVFAPIERFAEVVTWPLIRDKSLTAYLPTIKDERLIHIEFVGDFQIKVSDWGIPELQDGRRTTADQMDVVIVPLLAFDIFGNRVGYGKGFYDGFLSDCKDNCQFIGVSYFEAEDEIADVYEGDIKLHHCITPEKKYSF